MSSQPIKILFLIDELLPGGTENQLILLAEGLSRKYFTPVIGVLHETSFQSNLKIKTPIVNFNWQGISLIKNISLLFQIRSYLKQNNFNIIQTQFQEAAIYGHLALKLLHTKPVLIGTRRNLYHWIKDEPWSFRFYKKTAVWVDKIIANSRAAQELCIKLESIPEHKIVYIPNGIEIDRFSQIDPLLFKQEMIINGAFPIVGVVANWRPVKGLTVFLNAAASVSKKYPNAIFILVGKGQQKKELELLSKNLRIENQVLFIENPPNVPEIINSFDIAVQPSLSESFSNVLLEYMAAGKPVIATKVGDAEMVINNNKDGLLVEPDNSPALSDAIFKLLSDWDNTQKIGRNGQIKVNQNWSIKNILEQYQEFYFNILNQKELIIR